MVAESGGMEAIIRRPELAAATRRIGRPGVAESAAVREAVPVSIPAPDSIATHIAGAMAGTMSGSAPAAAGRAAPSAAPEELNAIKREAMAAALASVRKDQETQLQERLAAQRQAHEAEMEKLAQARRELDETAAAVLAAAREEGLAAGTRRGQADAREELSCAIDAVRAAAVALETERAALAAAQEEILVEMAFTAVCRVLGRHGASRAGVSAMVRTLLSEHAGNSQVTVHLHPGDAEMIAAGDSFGPQVRIAADPAVEMVGCLLVGERGTLDARLEVQVEALRAILLEVRAQRVAEEGGK